CVGRISRMHFSAGQAPKKETVDSTKSKPSCLRGVPCSIYMIKKPSRFGGGKVGIEKQPSAAREHCFVPVLLQSFANIRRTTILPNDGIVDRAAGEAIPDNRRFTLIGNAERRHIGRTCARLGHRIPHRR